MRCLHMTLALAALLTGASIPETRGQSPVETLPPAMYPVPDEMSAAHCPPAHDSCPSARCAPKNPCCAFWCEWICGRCDMVQHFPYGNTTRGYYYFRPYNYQMIPGQQDFVQSWGGDIRHPYTNEQFQAVYESMKKAGRDPAELIGAPKFKAPIEGEGPVSPSGEAELEGPVFEEQAPPTEPSAEPTAPVQPPSEPAAPQSRRESLPRARAANRSTAPRDLAHGLHDLLSGRSGAPVVGVRR